MARSSLLCRFLQFADFVDQQRPAGRRLEQPQPAVQGARKRTFLVAEQFALDQRLRDRGTVDGDERFAAPRAVVMERASHQLLAGAALADDKHGAASVSHQADLLEQGTHRCTLPDDVVERMPLVQLRVQLGDLGRHGTFFQGHLDAVRQFLQIDRLGEEIKGPFLERRHGCVDGPVAGHEDHGGVGSPILGDAQQFEPVDTRHAEVRDDHRNAVVHVVDRLLAAAHRNRVIAATFQPFAHGGPSIWVVVDQEDLPAPPRGRDRRGELRFPRHVWRLWWHVVILPCHSDRDKLALAIFCKHAKLATVGTSYCKLISERTSSEW